MHHSLVRINPIGSGFEEQDLETVSNSIITNSCRINCEALYRQSQRLQFFIPLMILLIVHSLVDLAW